MKNSILLLFAFCFANNIALSNAISANAGCTDSTACNYDCQATEDDGSCDFTCYGCTSLSAENYDENATIDDGTCVESTCFDWEYCYDINETSGFLFTTNFASEVVDLSFDAGDIEAGWDEIYFYDGVNNSAPLISGPIDGDLSGLTFQSTGQNLFVEIISDGSISCQNSFEISSIEATYCYVSTILEGCTSEISPNYNPEANQDDGFCEYLDCESSSSIDWESQSTGVFPSQITLNLGSEISIASIVNLNSTWLNEDDGNLYNIAGFELQSVTGLPEGIDQSLVSDVLPISVESGSQICLPLNGLIYPIGSFDVTYSGIITVLLGSIEIDLPATFEQTIEVIWDGGEILGCTYPGADNYNFVATLDNSLCVFSGCTDNAALNYLASANLEDGSCLYSESICEEGLIWAEDLQMCINPDPSCLGDLNGDENVTSTDLTIFLTAFGSFCGELTN